MTSCRENENKIEQLANNQAANLDIKKLKGKLQDIYRLIVGKFRVFYDTDYKIIEIIEILNRKDAYNG